ncbi:MAG: hypothetical protein OXT09_33205 [Myxococcales bacterium]|nr:hypothetical protein [Myxococcales bacterium]
MPAHQQALGAAAILVLSRQGSRGFTHRAVDRQAGLPEGTASRYARTRSDLLALAADRLFADDRKTSEQALRATSHGFTSIEAVEKGLERVTAALIQAEDHYRARVELQLEGARNPALRLHFQRGRAAFVSELASLLRAFEIDSARACADALVMAVDGALHRQLVLGCKPLTKRHLRRLFDAALEAGA